MINPQCGRAFSITPLSHLLFSHPLFTPLFPPPPPTSPPNSPSHLLFPPFLSTSFPTFPSYTPISHLLLPLPLPPTSLTSSFPLYTLFHLPSFPTPPSTLSRAWRRRCWRQGTLWSGISNNSTTPWVSASKPTSTSPWLDISSKVGVGGWVVGGR